jgi:DNA repair ATPase RecN
MADNKELQEAKKLLQEINTLRGKLSQTPLNMTDADAVKNIQSLRNELLGVQNSFKDVDDSATSLYDQIRAISGEFNKQPSALQKIRGSMSKITSIAEDLKMQEQGIKDLSTKNLDDLAEKLKQNKKILDDQTTSLVNAQDLSKAAQDDLKNLQQYVDLVTRGNGLKEQELDTALDLLQNSDRVWSESGQIVWFIKHRRQDPSKQKVDMKEFMWVKLSSLPI